MSRASLEIALLVIRVVVAVAYYAAIELLGAVDHVYYINLDRSLDRRVGMEGFFRDAGLGNDRYTRVPAVDGTQGLWRHRSSISGALEWELSVLGASGDELWRVLTWDQSAQRRGFAGPLEGRIVATTLSHLRVVYGAFQARHEAVIVLEDDARVGVVHPLSAEADFEEGGRNVSFKELLATLPEGWRLLQLGYVCAAAGKVRQMRQDYQDGFWARSRSPCETDWSLAGLHAYVLSRNGILALLRRYWPGFRSHLHGTGSHLHGTAAAADETPLIFDFRGMSNVAADYSFFSMAHVYVATRPFAQPPSSYASLLNNSESVMTLATTLVEQNFQSGPLGHANSHEKAAMAVFHAKQPPGTPQYFDVGPRRVVNNGSKELELVRLAGFDMHTLSAMAGCSKKTTAPPGACGWSFVEAWSYAHNCGFARMAQQTAACGSNVERGGAGRGEWAHLAYSNGLALQKHHFTLRISSSGSGNSENGAAAREGELNRTGGLDDCFAAADADVELVVSTAASEMATPWHTHEEWTTAAEMLKPALRRIARTRCSALDGG